MKGENIICMIARNNTRPKIKAIVLIGAGEVLQRITNVMIVMPMCHIGDETTKSEINMRAEAKKVNQINQGSPSALEVFG